MEQEMQSFLGEERIGVISVEMLDGSPHAAAIHFAHTTDPLTFIFLTGRASRKASPLLERTSTRASLVIGTNEDKMKTAQLDGVLEIGDPNEVSEAYFAKFPEKTAKYDESATFLKFTPTTWRYSDFKREGKTVLNSDESTSAE
jgi:general stress protein 26